MSNNCDICDTLGGDISRLKIWTCAENLKLKLDIMRACE